MRNSEAYRFMSAFYELLAVDPNTPPTPTELNDLLGLSGGRSINGRLSALRTKLLQGEGFIKGSNGRWTNDPNDIEKAFNAQMQAILAQFTPIPDTSQVTFTNNVGQTQAEIDDEAQDILDEIESIKKLAPLPRKRFRLSLRRH